MPPTLVADPSAVNTGTGSELLCLIGTLIVVGLALWLFVRHRGRATRRGGGVAKAAPDPSDPYGTVPTEALSNDANALLVAADDSLKTSEQEMTFATAQYGPVAAAEFATALEASRVDVAAAFHLRQLLDDDIPDDEPTTRAWYVEIIQRCQAADDRLDAHVEAFDKLRDLEANVETLIPGLAARRDADQIRVPRSEVTYAQLHQRFAPAAILAVSNSGQQIAERIDFADRTLRQAEEAAGAGNRPLAALAVRAVEEALGQVEMIFEAVDRLAVDLDAAMASVSSALAAVEADVASGQAALDAVSRGAAGASAGTVDLAAAVAGAAQVALSVRGEMAAAQPDPFAALRRLEQVDVRLSTALANIRDAASRAERARVMLETAIPAARAEIAAVTNFITTRRGAVGSEARTRIAEAERFLEQAVALAAADPVAALTAAQQADTLAERASELANHDVFDWSQPQMGGGVSMGGLGGLGGAVLGGILLEGMLGGGRRNRGSGGGFGWGGRMPGSFGGPGTRARMRF